MKYSGIIAAAALSVGALLSSNSAQAAVLYTLGNTGELETPGFIDAVFQAGAGAGSASFVIQGYRTLDGENNYTDIFTLSLNGSPLYQATFSLGGGGNNVTYQSLPGATVDYNGDARTVSITAPLTFTNGSNTLRFAYSGGAQGTGDEAWGLNSVSVSGSAFEANGVPEPATWAMMLLGFGALGATVRRSRKSGLQLQA